MNSTSRIMTLPCLHAYHADCIRNWIMHGYESCPVCRKQLTREEVYCVRNKRMLGATPEQDNEVLRAELTRQREAEYQAEKLAQKLMAIDNEYKVRAGYNLLFIRAPAAPPKPMQVSTSVGRSIPYHNRELEYELEITNTAIARSENRISYYRDSIKSNARFVKEMRRREDNFMPSLNDRKWNGDDLSWLW